MLFNITPTAFALPMLYLFYLLPVSSLILELFEFRMFLDDIGLGFIFKFNLCMIVYYNVITIMKNSNLLLCDIHLHNHTDI